MKRLLSYMMNLYFRFAFFRKGLWWIFVLAVFAVAAALIFQNSRVSTNPVGWEKGFQVSSYNIVARDMSVASRGDVVVTAYEGLAGGAPGIYASISFNGGGGLLPPPRGGAVAAKTTPHTPPA